MGQISVEISRRTGSVLRGNQHAGWLSLGTWPPGPLLLRQAFGVPNILSLGAADHRPLSWRSIRVVGRLTQERQRSLLASPKFAAGSALDYLLAAKLSSAMILECRRQELAGRLAERKALMPRIDQLKPAVAEDGGNRSLFLRRSEAVSAANCFPDFQTQAGETQKHPGGCLLSL